MKTTCRTEKEIKALKNRLSRIEGQIRALGRMVDEDAYCMDIITQAMAASSALNSFSRELMSQHISTCVTNGIKNGDETVTEELNAMLGRLFK